MPPREESFFPQTQNADRTPRNIDFSEPETANWAEIAETVAADPALKQDLETSFTRATERNQNNPNIVKTILRIAAALGLTVAVITGAATMSDSKELPAEPGLSDTSGVSPEQQAAVEAMNSTAEQEAAEAAHQSATQEAQTIEAQKFEEALQPKNDIPPTDAEISPIGD